MVVAKLTLTRPSSKDVRAVSAVLETASRPSCTTSVVVNVAFSAGSSKQQKARRASVDSNWVVAMVWVSPESSVKVDR